MLPNPEFTRFDFIGDIHGHADALEALLIKLGYDKSKRYFSHPERKVIFAGDFIDRGPKIKETLEMVRAMIDNQSAYTVIGNHEFNAICYWTAHQEQPLRVHSPKNKKQHAGTIASFEPDILLLRDYIDWFKTLPIYIEHPSFRMVHAQWNPRYIATLKEKHRRDFSDPDFLIRSATHGSEEYKIIDCLLKGAEVKIPGVIFTDKDGHKRESYRIRWWMQGQHIPCRDLFFEFPQTEEKLYEKALLGYATDERPVFFGHYWMKNPAPVLQQPNVACLDFSIAKGGILVAYRWNGEKILNAGNFVWV